MHFPDGVALTLTGSGVYWVLSSQLIASFSVLAPGLFQTSSQGVLLVLLTGVISSAAGLWIIQGDLESLQDILNHRGGWVFTTPILLAVTDISLTLVGVRTSVGVVELNPFVASAIEAGAASLLPFTICYILMSEGLALLMLDLGRRLFFSNPTLTRLPFCLICGSAALGPFSNFALIVNPGLGSLALLAGITGATGLSAFLYHFLERARRVSSSEGPTDFSS
ncbi:hypothetical protein E6H36_09210 [Candidatus Bathyarchaeota archaeon]|nr:MAG: hypothetical protein E6H36_09210 [Candidatus Bathyarchaeota archaeon]